MIALDEIVDANAVPEAEGWFRRLRASKDIRRMWPNGFLKPTRFADYFSILLDKPLSAPVIKFGGTLCPYETARG